MKKRRKTNEKTGAAPSAEKPGGKGSRLRKFPAAALAAYSLFMLYLLLIRGRGNSSADPAVWRQTQISLIPFRSISAYLSGFLTETAPARRLSAVINLGGNLFLFVPFGFLLPCLSEKFRSLKNVLLLMAAAVSAVEIIQLLTCRGHCDIDDLILNLAGTAAGFFLYRSFRTCTGRCF